jgi:hypothetical protein
MNILGAFSFHKKYTHAFLHCMIFLQEVYVKGFYYANRINAGLFIMHKPNILTVTGDSKNIYSFMCHFLC